MRSMQMEERRIRGVGDTGTTPTRAPPASRLDAVEKQLGTEVMNQQLERSQEQWQYLDHTRYALDLQ